MCLAGKPVDEAGNQISSAGVAWNNSGLRRSGERYGIPSTPADLRDHRIAALTSAWASPKWRFTDDHRVTI
ncbi:hypothetical protein [Rhizobium sp. GR12]|uniref:hypothetical protein n=1 Tax=Rhizobium sp. GR12 TaxID=3053925 RepID=UPI002FBD30D1